jgi:hypothetical protein
MLQIRLAKTTEDKKIADNLVVQHHSYVATARTVGRCLKYIISLDGVDIGTFWIGSGFKPTPKAILNYFHKSQKEYDIMFNTVADNKRFAMAVRIPNLGSQILKEIRNRAAQDWYDSYGDNLIAIVTTIGADKNGAVYLADNWQKIGETAGLPAKRKSVSMKWDDKNSISEKFVKPTGENKKLILITTRLKKRIENENQKDKTI